METLKVISLSQKSAWWKTVAFSVRFIILTRIRNTSWISKEIVLPHYADITVKFFEENSEITQGEEIFNAN